MKKFLLTSAAFIALGATSYAADLPAPMAPVEPMPVVAPYSWTGFYLGVHAGYAWGERDFDLDDDPAFNDEFPFEYDLDGFVGGAQIGANYQWNWLVARHRRRCCRGPHMDEELSYDIFGGPARRYLSRS